MARWVVRLVAALVIALGTVALAPVGIAGAGPVCEHRSAAHIERHGGLTADSAWHVRHGQRPTCGADEASRDGGPKASAGKDKGKDRDRKSRFCRKRWWC